MKLLEILETRSENTLQQLAKDKIEGGATVGIPRSVLVREIHDALSKQSYVAKILAPLRPPTYAILRTLLDAPEGRLPMDGFRTEVMSLTDQMSLRAEEGNNLSREKNYDLYRELLRFAWENDGMIDRSEELLLEALRKCLGIWTREHFIIEHHPQIRGFWDDGDAYARSIGVLLDSGVVFCGENQYYIADEAAAMVRGLWGVDICDSDYRRLLEHMTVADLRNSLDQSGLAVSGSKDEMMDRVVKGLVPPGEVLDRLHIDEVKDICRKCGLHVSASKSELIQEIIGHYSLGRGLATIANEVAKPQPDPGAKVLRQSDFIALLQHVTTDNLCDIASAVRIGRSGSKNDRIKSIVESAYSEKALLSPLRRYDLAALCRRLSIPVSGVKEELIERLIQGASGGAYASIDPRWRRIRTSEVEVAAEVKPVPDGSSPEDLREPRDPALESAQTLFPHLMRQEHVIVARLMEAGSLSETDIRLLSKNKSLGWFLIRAQMEQLIGKLEAGGEARVAVLCDGPNSVYRWSVNPENSGGQLGQAAARDVIEALRQGVVPEKDIDRLVTGQEEARQHLVELLDHIATGKSAFKFIRGPYGSGKTFLTSWIREQALIRGFAVGSVRIGPDLALGDLPVFYAGLTRGLRVRHMRGASAFANILESWLLAVHQKAASMESKEMVGSDTKQLSQRVEHLISEILSPLSSVAAGVTPAVWALYRARRDFDSETASAALAWLQGNENLTTQVLKRIGVRGALEGHEVMPRIRALLEIIRGGNYRGLLVLVDELELVRRLPHRRQRDEAYETLRLLIDDVGENRLPRCLMLFTGTDILFDDAQYGLPSYEALATRLQRPNAGDGLTSMRQPVIRLEAFDQRKLLSIAEIVVRLHGTAYGWDATARVPGKFLERAVGVWSSFGATPTDRLPRPILRDLVNVLDLCEENDDVLPDQCLGPAKTPQSEPISEIARILEDAV